MHHAGSAKQPLTRFVLGNGFVSGSSFALSSMGAVVNRGVPTQHRLPNRC